MRELEDGDDAAPELLDRCTISRNHLREFPVRFAARIWGHHLPNTK